MATFIASVEWVHEDELDSLPRPPSEPEYRELFESSRVIDGVRMFPSVVIGDRPVIGVDYLVRRDS